MAGLMGASSRLHRLETLERHFHAAALHRRLLAGDSHWYWSWAGVERKRRSRYGCWPRRHADLLVSSDAEHDKGLRRPNLPLALPGYEQEPYPAMVRHEDLRQPDEGAKTPCTVPGKRRGKLKF